MFTGIITDIGTVTAIRNSGEKHFTLATSYDTTGIALGASIACDGCCLTVVEKAAGWFAVEVSQESLSCTTLGNWTVGRKVNLERALKVGDELGGHMVSGHVDGITTIESIEQTGESRVLWLSLPKAYAKFIAPKGSVVLDGISLTVNAVEAARFSINVIPHTLNHTTLGLRKTGDTLNLEIDTVARYIARMTEVKP